MAISSLNRVREGSTSTGAGPITLLGVQVPDFISFIQAFQIGENFAYTIQHRTLNEYEHGVGTLLDDHTLVRLIVLGSSNGGGFANFSPGNKDVTADIPSIFLVSDGQLGDLIHLDSNGIPVRLPIGSASQVLTVSSGLPSWQDASSGSTPPFSDSTAIVKDDADNTKLLRFDLSGLTAGTTRTITPPDANLTLAGQDFANVFTLLNTFNISPTAPQNSTSERFGANATNGSTESVAIGYNASTADRLEIAIGKDCSVSGGLQNTCIGAQASISTSGGGGCTVIGADASVTGGAFNCTLVGKNASSSSDNVVSVGTGNTVSNGAFMAFGISVAATANEAMGFGIGLTVSHENSVVFGRNAATSRNGEIVFGFDNVGSIGGARDCRIRVAPAASANVNRDQFIIDGSWIDGTDLTRTSRLSLHVFYTSSAQEGIRLDASSAGCNFSFFGPGSWGGGINTVFIPNAITNPSSNPSGGGIVYADSGALKYRGSAGTTTTLGPAEPHCPACGSDFVSEFDSDLYGYLCLCLRCLAGELGERPWILRKRA